LNSPEQEVVAEVYAGGLRHDGYEVTVQNDMGSRQDVEPLLRATAIDMYIDRGGSLLDYLRGGQLQAGSDGAANLASLRTILGSEQISVVGQAPATETNTVLVSTATAQRYHLQAVSDLTRVASQLTTGGSADCPSEPLCLPGLSGVYGLHFKSFVPQGNAADAVGALRAGTLDAAVVPSDSGAASQPGVVALADDRHLQPPNHLTPLVRTLRDTPELNHEIQAISSHLTTDQLTKLNTMVIFNKKRPDEVAGEWDRQQYLAS
jgi:osmoprotectant transport system substrate-binding protein